jgi:lysophospholipase L1-like esterase
VVSNPPGLLTSIAPLALKLGLAPLLVAQAVAARRRTPVMPEAAGPRRGVVGQGAPLRLLVVGDSSAAGVGVERQSRALALPMARRLAADTGRRVRWQLVAKSGVTTAQALALLRDGPPVHADVAVVVTGVNDVVDQVPSHRAVASREALANWLRNSSGAGHVVFAPLPPVHQFPALPRPLRWIAGADARRHDRALAAWAATRADVSYVDIGMRLNRGVMARDGFHPGEPVYRQCATMIARHIAALLGPPEPGDDR